MGKAQKQWAKRARLNLEIELGLKCNICDDEDGPFEFDCIIPQGDNHHRKDTASRMCFYRAQHRQKNIQLLCEDCHYDKTQEDKQTHPF